MDDRDIPDSTDWLTTSLPGLSSLESALHCQICKEFYDTPMITTCCHTFCSKCIRTALSTDGKCPACRTNDQASKLRNNWQLQEIVATFLQVRAATLNVARDHKQSDESTQPRKRKRDPIEQPAQDGGGRTTRSKSRRLNGSQTSYVELAGDHVDEHDDSEDDSVQQTVPDDGLVECPLGCGKRMKIESVEPHLDRCEEERQAEAQTAQRARAPVGLVPPRQDRINELNYGMMKEGQLSRKMRELGISTFGSKQLMIRRHLEWVNIWNANCDSSNPRPKRDLLRDLDTWERTQGGNAPMVVNGIMKKDFDGPRWSKNNQSEFDRLIANARKSRAEVASKIDAANCNKAGDAIESTKSPPIDHGETAQHNAEGAQTAPEAAESQDQPVEQDQPGEQESSEQQESSHSASQTAAEPQFEHTALMEQARFGNVDSQDAEREENVEPQNGQDSEQSPSMKLKSAGVRRMPMFAMQEQPMNNIDGFSPTKTVS